MVRDINLPLFVYGLFKPGQLAYRQIERLVDGRPQAASVNGELYIRDGLPLFNPLKTDNAIKGYILNFKTNEAQHAYNVVADFEPEEHYKWDQIELPETKQKANILIGRIPEKGSILLEHINDWSGSLDPVFTSAMKLVNETAEDYGRKPFEGELLEADWIRLFRLQMGYLLLWSGIERFAALAYGPKLDPMRKIFALGNDPLFQGALRKSVQRTSRITDCRDPNCDFFLNSNNPQSSAKYFYQVRNNLSHRGKGAWKDGEIVRNALLELNAIFELMRHESLFSK